MGHFYTLVRTGHARTVVATSQITLMLFNVMNEKSLALHKNR